MFSNFKRKVTIPHKTNRTKAANLAVLVQDSLTLGQGFDHVLFWNLPQCHHDPTTNRDTISVLQKGVLTLRLAADYQWVIRVNGAPVATSSHGTGNYSKEVDVAVSPGDSVRIGHGDSVVVATSNYSALLVLEFVTSL